MRRGIVTAVCGAQVPPADDVSSGVLWSRDPTDVAVDGSRLYLMSGSTTAVCIYWTGRTVSVVLSSVLTLLSCNDKFGRVVGIPLMCDVLGYAPYCGRLTAYLCRFISPSRSVRPIGGTCNLALVTSGQEGSNASSDRLGWQRRFDHRSC